jgi:hypothetical protein
MIFGNYIGLIVTMLSGWQTIFSKKITKDVGARYQIWKKMKSFFRVVSYPGYQNSVAEELGIHRSTVSKLNGFVMERILSKANIWIKFPKSTQEIVEAKQQWLQTNEFLYVIGVIDFSHVRIPKFCAFGDEYINRKGFPSINVQATCNAREIFTSVDC